MCDISQRRLGLALQRQKDHTVNKAERMQGGADPRRKAYRQLGSLVCWAM